MDLDAAHTGFILWHLHLPLVHFAAIIPLDAEFECYRALRARIPAHGRFGCAELVHHRKADAAQQNKVRELA